MTCRQFHQQVDRLVFGDLPPVEQEALRAHAAFCNKCAELWETELHLRDGLAAQSIPEPTADFESRIRTRVLSGSKASSSRAQATNLKRAPVWGSAIAAVLALGVFIGMQISPSEIRDQEPTVATAPTPESVETGTGPELKTVRLAFNSRTAMDNVTLTLEMPPNAELAPFPGRQSISWKIN
jgi:anti-sigma factor RsiW